MLKRLSILMLSLASILSVGMANGNVPTTSTCQLSPNNFVISSDYQNAVIYFYSYPDINYLAYKPMGSQSVSRTYSYNCNKSGYDNTLIEAVVMLPPFKNNAYISTITYDLSTEMQGEQTKFPSDYTKNPS